MQTKAFSQNRLYCARAKYVPDGFGGLKLAMVQGFDHPVFNPSTIRERRPGLARDDDDEEVERELIGAADSVERATRRAKIAAFDKILCNEDLDTFATFTYSAQTADYDTAYGILRPWLSNRVQRNNLKYIIVPERHKSGAIHFHAIANSAALKLERAHSARTGRPLSHAGNPLFNVTDWREGFTSAELIRASAVDREKVAKYIFKYMGKQTGQKIGGRYMLAGGDLKRPHYEYSDSVEALLDGSTVKYDRVVSIPGGGQYFEFSTL